MSKKKQKSNLGKPEIINSIMTDKRQRVVIPQAYLSGLLQKLHSELALPGSKKHYKTLNEHICSKNLKAEVEKVT